MTPSSGLHLVVFSRTTAFTAASTLEALDAATDGILQKMSTTALVLGEKARILAAYAGAATLERAVITSPGFLEVLEPDIRPISGALLPPTDPNVQDLLDGPLVVRPGEPLGVKAAVTTTTDDAAAVLLLQIGEYIPLPKGSIYTARFARTTNLTSLAFAWATGTVDFVGTLPSGRYAIVGMDIYFVSGTAVNILAARLTLPGSPWRPGVLAQGSASSRSAEIFRDGSPGVMGVFDSFSGPGLEVFCDAAASDLKYAGTLRLVRLGDIGDGVGGRNSSCGNGCRG